MKTLLEIQKEVKELGTKIQDMADSLEYISKDIQEIRTSGDTMEMDYDMIRMLAKNVPFENHPLARLEGYACKIYIELLLSVMHMDTSGIAEKMAYIQWILEESRIDMSLENVHIESLELQKDIYSEIREVLNTEYRMFFIVDALIIANFAGKASEEATEYIAKLCTLLNVNVSLVEICIILARIAVEQDSQNIKETDIERVMPFIQKYEYCITRDTIDKAEMSRRVVCIDISDDDLRADSSLTWLVKQKSMVREGDRIAKYRLKQGPTQEACAPKNGKLFQFRSHKKDSSTDDLYFSKFLRKSYRRIGVITHPSDTDKQIKKWLKEKYGEDVVFESVGDY